MPTNKLKQINCKIACRTQPFSRGTHFSMTLTSLVTFNCLTFPKCSPSPRMLRHPTMFGQNFPLLLIIFLIGRQDESSHAPGMGSLPDAKKNFDFFRVYALQKLLFKLQG